MTSDPNEPVGPRADHQLPPDVERNETELRAEAEALGLTQLVFRDDEAPQVDHELLLALARRQLSERVSRLVYRLVFSYQTWNDAFTQAVVCYAGEHGQTSAPPEAIAPSEDQTPGHDDAGSP